MFNNSESSSLPNLQVFKFLRLLLRRYSMNVRLVCCFLPDYIFQQMSGAALFNLSLLTSDMWAVVVRIFIYRQEVSFLDHFLQPEPRQTQPNFKSEYIICDYLLCRLTGYTIYLSRSW